MRHLAALLFIPLYCHAQDLTDTLKKGEQIFVLNCSTGYCHGTKGVGGGGPRLAGRGLEQPYINNTVTRGVDQTSMPSFSGTLSRADIVAVVAYVATLNGIANPTINIAGGANAQAPPVQPLSPEAETGRLLFSEATRALARCSRCHEINGIGIPVATPIADVPADVAALHKVTASKVVTAEIDGQSMPAVVLSNTSKGAVFYDLTGTLPVMRTADTGKAKFTNSSTWQHSAALSAYKDDELQSVLAYLRAVTPKFSSN